MNYYIGVDLGGTNVRACKTDEDGNIIEQYDNASYGLIGPKEKIRDAIFKCLDNIHDIDKTRGIGIAVPGPVNVYKKVMSLSSNLVGFKDYNLADLLEERYKLPVFIDNDANMAGLAEATLGAGKDEDIVYYITHSTGIGGALVIGKKVVSGQKGFAGEIGNIIVKDNGQKYVDTLNAGSVESEASGRALSRIAKDLLGDNASSKDLFDEYQKGNKKAIKMVDEMAYDMGRLLATIGQVVDPHVFVIGGGVSNHQADIYWPKMLETYHKLFNGSPAKVVKAKLKEPGILGAAMLVKTSLD